jgi:uncharacterized protein (TIGR02271 family)
MSSDILFRHRNAKEKAYRRCCCWKITFFVNSEPAVVGQVNDGERKLPVAADSEQTPKGSIDDPKLTLLAEELSVAKETLETGRLRVSKQTRTREAFVEKNLRSEHAEIETIPVGRQIFEVPSVRQEGDTIIIPIVEEVLHTERRLILKEEIKITRRQKTEQFHDRVTLRYQEAVITRVKSATEPADIASAKETKSSVSRVAKWLTRLWLLSTTPLIMRTPRSKP